ncbi:hypothetical protein [Bradyrhizobium sp. SEMIA]|uniref:hypothetical protein n=1 Tax=Bradyrhizobium sp. SEMIA TaxID=2597515 RepID=UPI0018A58BE3|nr:hypothetical protein [Bradyrhizobium sp. SEMIA]QOG20895.1 hypothetical protein FOM02_29700 [Bradyrhizobium sp. SEMIA]
MPFRVDKTRAPDPVGTDHVAVLSELSRGVSKSPCVVFWAFAKPKQTNCRNQVVLRAGYVTKGRAEHIMDDELVDLLPHARQVMVVTPEPCGHLLVAGRDVVLVCDSASLPGALEDFTRLSSSPNHPPTY